MSLPVFATSLHDRIGDALAQLVSVLAIPVLLLAIAALLLCAVECGRYATEAWQRHSRRRQWPLKALAARAVAAPGEASQLAAHAPTAFAADAVQQLGAAVASGRPRAAEHALTDFELAVQKRLDRTRMLVRAGPAIGLMGTLIPLAPGLKALSGGDISQLAADLRIAFAATVVGLLVGTVAFALTLVRTRLYSEDLAALERAAEQLPAGGPAAGPALAAA
ncbi:MotA/TolQ/ExbB proton channel family protein [Conexibacter sp. JD483]|uniref:MotA/TolQ/ExbB proton channel family protein n=1 Tax=unclassified Conexibacter TaxID=2627773 RepID=UPI00271B4368|nr:MULTISPECIES: MotA/TolQ/ExbB proton channel family protein [unclassified Conexibacter]MDO8187595.1 MotA/TolQ/ExbB proton channel family protein [Conexibacter sp. CPCC 205706]MDO8201073.1 MotA/TolQ/ExbB proton channel family protein [Conexibacter sp. CPCC 205762]MDR9371822.1 MotA/TolQ/ExbB proton channel family protein [Conexibacter sp. JD483]